MPRELDRYRLPSGAIVPCDASAVKNARVIDFTLADGRIVQARRVDPPRCEICGSFADGGGHCQGGRCAACHRRYCPAGLHKPPKGEPAELAAPVVVGPAMEYVFP